MKAVYCDRCGKQSPYVPPYMNVATGDGYIPPSLIITKWDSVKQMYEAVDLCKDCKRDVYDYIFDYGNGNNS